MYRAAAGLWPVTLSVATRVVTRASEYLEQTVMAYAQAHDDVELGARFVEQRRLSDRIAHVLPHGVALFVDAYIGLRHCTPFADCAVDVKIVAAQDF